MRLLWEQHVYWTRFFIISTAACLKDLDEVTKRLLRNPKDFTVALMPFYGTAKSERFGSLLTEHLEIGGELVNALKAENSQKTGDARDRWYENADEIASFLASINRFWCEDEWRNMLYFHLELTEREASERLSCQFARDIATFDEIEKEALQMADYMACGIMRQCFNCSNRR